MLYLSIAIFIIFLFYHFYRRIKYAVKPLGLSLSNTEFFKQLDNDSHMPKISIKEEEKDNKKVIEKKKNEHIQRIIGTKYLIMFLSFQMERYSKMTFLILMLSKIIGTFTLCILISGLVNYGIYKISNSNFVVNLDGIVTFYDFLIYGFFNVAPDGIYVEPNSRLAWGVKTCFGYVGVVLIGIFITSIFTTLTSSFEPIIKSLVTSLNDRITKYEDYLQEEYEMNEEEAVEYLEKKEFKGIEVIYQLRTLIE